MVMIIGLPFPSIRILVIVLSLVGIGQAHGKKTKKGKDNIFEKKRGNIPEKYLKTIPNDVINAFKTRQGIMADWELDLEVIDTYDNTIRFPESDIVVSLNNLEPYSVLASSGAANCYKEDVQIPCGDPTVYVGYDEKSGSRIQVNKDDDQVIESIILRRENVPDGTMIKETLQAITGLGKKWKGGQLFASVPTNALDATFYKQYSMESLKIPPNGVRSLRHNTIPNDEIVIVQNVTSVNIGARRPNRHRRLACGTTFREIELAVAVDSTFCEQVGGSKNAQPTVNRILADVTEEYEIDGLCWKVTMVHYEEVSCPCFLLVLVSRHHSRLLTRANFFCLVNSTVTKLQIPSRIALEVVVELPSNVFEVFGIVTGKMSTKMSLNSFRGRQLVQVVSSVAPTSMVPVLDPLNMV